MLCLETLIQFKNSDWISLEFNRKLRFGHREWMYSMCPDYLSTNASVCWYSYLLDVFLYVVIVVYIVCSPFWLFIWLQWYKKLSELKEEQIEEIERKKNGKGDKATINSHCLWVTPAATTIWKAQKWLKYEHVCVFIYNFLFSIVCNFVRFANTHRDKIFLFLLFGKKKFNYKWHLLFVLFSLSSTTLFAYVYRSLFLRKVTFSFVVCTQFAFYDTMNSIFIKFTKRFGLSALKKKKKKKKQHKQCLSFYHRLNRCLYLAKQSVDFCLCYVYSSLYFHHIVSANQSTTQFDMCQ